MATNTVKLKFAYKDATTRDYDFAINETALKNVEENIIAVNQSLSANTDGGLKSFFVSNGGASFVQISEAQIISVTETVLDLGGGN